MWQDVLIVGVRAHLGELEPFSQKTPKNFLIDTKQNAAGTALS